MFDAPNARAMGVLPDQNFVIQIKLEQIMIQLSSFRTTYTCTHIFGRKTIAIDFMIIATAAARCVSTSLQEERFTNFSHTDEYEARVFTRLFEVALVAGQFPLRTECLSRISRKTIETKNRIAHDLLK